jgi:hypothetical protein
MDALRKLAWCLTRSLQCLNNINSPGSIVSNILPKIQLMRDTVTIFLAANVHLESCESEK